MQPVAGAAGRDRERLIPKASNLRGTQQDGAFRHRRVIDVTHRRRLHALSEQRASRLRRSQIVAQTLFVLRASLAQLLRCLVVPCFRWWQRSRGAASQDGKAGRGEDEPPDRGEYPQKPSSCWKLESDGVS